MVRVDPKADLRAAALLSLEKLPRKSPASQVVARSQMR
jgi:hypothetical protein